MNNLTAVMADFAANQADRDVRVGEQIAELKAALIPLLRASGIARVEVCFDGSGDSGAVEEVLCFDAADNSLACPDLAFSLPCDDRHDGAADYAPPTLSAALEQITYLALERHHPGWENNDGGRRATGDRCRGRQFCARLFLALHRHRRSFDTDLGRRIVAHCNYHALSSVRKWGGELEDYLPVHQWFDQSKAILADPRHRALRHHAEGIFMLEALFGATLANADGRTFPVRLIGEQHVREDLGFIPSFADWARLITPQAWMLRGHPLDGAEAMPVERDDPGGGARSAVKRPVRPAAETVIIDV